MSLHVSKDYELFKQNINKILEEVTKKRYEILEPTKDEMVNVYEIIIDFIKQTKRKVYGGYALNAIVKDKNKDDAIYSEIDMPDIDFYSPEPILDLMKLCNILYDKGFKTVIGQEAMHKETYSVYVNQNLYCDISYVPRNIYNKMPFKEINGINYIHPHFMMIDYLRMITDPMISYWRIEKVFNRFIILQKNYQLPTNNSPIDIIGSNNNLDYALDIIYKYLLNKKTTAVIGFYAYNFYLNKSGILTEKKKNLKILDVPYYEIISTNYRDDARELISLLKKNCAGKIKDIEYYPFFQLTGFSVEIFLDDDLIARIYNHNKRCIPFFDINAERFYNNKVEYDLKNKIRIGTYMLTFLFSLIQVMISRTNDDNDTKNLQYTIMSHMIEYRNYFFETNKKNIFDDTIFKDFVIDCMGDTIEPAREKRIINALKKKQNKRYNFRYEPEIERKEPETNFVFTNSSGNPIKKDSNKKLLDIIKDEDIYQIEEDEDDKK